MKLFFKSLFMSTLGKAVIGLLVAGLFLRFPALTSWLGEDVQKPILATCYEIKSWGVAIVLMFAKSFNQTGGTKPITPEAETRIAGNP